MSSNDMTMNQNGNFQHSFNMTPLNLTPNGSPVLSQPNLPLNRFFWSYLYNILQCDFLVFFYFLYWQLYSRIYSLKKTGYCIFPICLLASSDYSNVVRIGSLIIQVFQFHKFFQTIQSYYSIQTYIHSIFTSSYFLQRLFQIFKTEHLNKSLQLHQQLFPFSANKYYNLSPYNSIIP